MVQKTYNKQQHLTVVNNNKSENLDKYGTSAFSLLFFFSSP